MSVVFDIVIAFVVLVIAVVVIKYALILGAAVWLSSGTESSSF